MKKRREIKGTRKKEYWIEVKRAELIRSTKGGRKEAEDKIKRKAKKLKNVETR